MWTVSLPTWIQVSKKTKFYLNLNPFRNANFHTLNKAKVMFTEQVSPLLRSIPVMDTVELTFTLYTGDKGLCDISNVCSIVDKFFTDTLVACGKIKDDNYTVVVSVRYRFGGIVKGAPRVDVLITPNPKPEMNQEEIMKITLDQNEIEQAVKDYIGNQLTIREDQRVDIDLKATRGENGFTAAIDIVPLNSPVKPPEIEQPAKQPTPKPTTPPVVTPTPTPVPEVKPTPVPAEPVKEPVAEQPAATTPVRDAAEPVVTTPATTETVELPSGDTAAADGTPLANPESEAPVVAKPRTSLFGANLRKPAN